MVNAPVRWSLRGHPEPFRKSGHARTILHSSASNEAYTPPHIMRAGTHALGGVIDVDPCSCAVANEEVGARRYLTKGDDGLNTEWFPDGEPGTLWCNPPGGFLDRETLQPAVRGMSSACAWWYELLCYYRAGLVTSALYYTFRLDVLQNIQAIEGYEPPHAFPFCVFGERPRHYSEDTPREDRGQKGRPTHACAVFFLPERFVGNGLELSHTDALEAQRAGLARFGRPVNLADHFPISPERTALACGSNKASAPWGYHGPSVDRFREAFEPLGYVRI